MGRMAAKMVLVTMAAGLALGPVVALAQFGTTAAPVAPEFPYRGRINADLVNIRCGPGLYYYPLVALEEGTPVTVYGTVRGWLAINPPAGVFGLVRHTDVTVDAAGQAATVSAPEARVYASSPSAERGWCVMAVVKQGDTLALSGPPQGDLLRVGPPEGSRAYVVAQYVSRAGGTPPSTGGEPPPTGTDVRIIDQPPPERIEVEVDVPDLKQTFKAFRATDAAMVEELAKPLDQRDYDALIARYQTIADATDKRYVTDTVASRIAQLESMADQKEEYLSTREIRDRLEESLAAIRSAQAGGEEATETGDLAPPAFAATGVVARLESLEGVDHPVRFKLLDRQGRIVVVLRSDAYDLDQYLGKAVGVRGPKSYRKEWGVHEVAVDDLEVLE